MRSMMKANRTEKVVVTASAAPMLARPVLCSRPSCISRVNKQSRRGVVAVRASAGDAALH